jgi:hypothetical protein
MTTDQVKALRDDFAACTGGFGPENGNEICVCIESSMPDLDPEEAIDELLGWMFETYHTLQGWGFIDGYAHFKWRRPA